MAFSCCIGFWVCFIHFFSCCDTGLGPTVPEIGVERETDTILSKTCFTMCLPQVEEKLKEIGTESVILCGIETQACIQKTALDLLERGLDVHIIADACSSRSMVDRYRLL